MFTNVCIWISTRNWGRFARRAAITYLFILAGTLGANLVRLCKLPSPPALIGYTLLIGSYAATGKLWSR